MENENKNIYTKNMRILKMFILFSLFLSTASVADARIYWLGRRIDVGNYDGCVSPYKRTMLPKYHHSYLVVIPDNP